MTATGAPTAVTRRAIRVRGAVQGVGFRPFVWRLANELRLEGFVRNDAHGVEIEAMLEMDAMIATLEFVARSDWVTILPSVISVNDIGRGALIVNPIINPELHAEFVVIQPTRRKLSMQARMFLERFEAEVTHIHNIWDRAIAEPARKLRA